MWSSSLLVALAPNLCTLWQWWSSPSQPDCGEGWRVRRGNRGGLTHILKREIHFITKLQRDRKRVEEREKFMGWLVGGGGDSFYYRTPKQKTVPVVTDCLCKCLWCSEWRCEAALQLIKSETYRDTAFSLQTDHSCSRTYANTLLPAAQNTHLQQHKLLQPCGCLFGSPETDCKCDREQKPERAALLNPTVCAEELNDVSH